MALDEGVVDVIEDDHDMRKSIERLLSAYGVRTRVFISAEEFLLAKSEPRARCLIVDIGLGGISGIELRRQLAASGSDIPTIFITARDDASTMTHVAQVGCVACLLKPFSGRDLIRAIELAGV